MSGPILYVVSVARVTVLHRPEVHVAQHGRQEAALRDAPHLHTTHRKTLLIHIDMSRHASTMQATSLRVRYPQACAIPDRPEAAEFILCVCTPAGGSSPWQSHRGHRRCGRSRPLRLPAHGLPRGAARAGKRGGRGCWPPGAVGAVKARPPSTAASAKRLWGSQETKVHAHQSLPVGWRNLEPVTGLRLLGYCCRKDKEW